MKASGCSCESDNVALSGDALVSACAVEWGWEVTLTPGCSSVDELVAWSALNDGD